MTYTQQGDRITLEMTRDQYDKLMFMLGCARGSSVSIDDKATFYDWLRFANELNNGNPNFTPYEIPEEYAAKGGAR